MTSAYLLAATLLICSVSAFSQQQNGTTSNSAANRVQEGSTLNLSADSVKNFVADSNSLKLLSPNDPMNFASPGQRIDDTVCYKIRSYVVARDSKDSDSVHPVGYSTCQPSTRYRLRTTDQKLPLNR